MPVFDGHEYLTEEERRLKEDRDRKKYWKKWGSYVAERQWATGQFPCLVRFEEVSGSNCANAVREDYSEDGDAWSRKFPELVDPIFSLMSVPRQTFRTTTLDRGRTDGVRTVLLVSPTHMAYRTLLLRFGMRRSMANSYSARYSEKIADCSLAPFSRKDSSVCPTRRETMARA